jgi:hypothetical protein
VRLTGYVVIELETGKFQPEYASKLNFYVALVDDVLRRDYHNDTIGILICGTKNDRSVRYGLGRFTSPMAVAAYAYDKLPADEQRALPNEGHLVAALEWAEPVPKEPRRPSRPCWRVPGAAIPRGSATLENCPKNFGQFHEVERFVFQKLVGLTAWIEIEVKTGKFPTE